MRRTSFSVWLLLAAVVAAIGAARLGRALGPIGIVVAVVLVVVVLILVRDMVLAVRAGSAAPDRGEAPMKNVTPHEAALPPGGGPSRDPVSAATPTVIVIDPPDATQQLAARLQALDGLRAEGLVSDAEYEAKRAQLIADL